MSRFRKKGEINLRGVGGYKNATVDFFRIMELILQDRLQREAVQCEEKQHWEEEKKRRGLEHEQQMKHMQNQMDLMKSMIESREDDLTRRSKIGYDQLKVMKLTDT